MRTVKGNLSAEFMMTLVVSLLIMLILISLLPSDEQNELRKKKVYATVLLKDLAWSIEEVSDGGHATTTDFILPNTLTNGDDYNISYSNGLIRIKLDDRFYSQLLRVKSLQGNLSVKGNLTLSNNYGVVVVT